ncbi:hypothetical protein [Flavobacterium quisquiliarum]|uniref:YqaJ viral recombinase domain-containing protein n=1 Tax=Flavobacterium quisquiliarum TaxID=1834436 RepID=A0ABV8WC13_9FLAO|nr:hypothetical protein [Flavobacterium quisquiliarum]MBW1656740.1 hypothetical protein [Flavobacterium quisquiliarum]NWL00367.1 hypothetical protein [Flavobacterium collinsii]
MKLNHKIIEQKDYYYVSNTKAFLGLPISKVQIQQVIDFSFEMCFGKGHHRNCRTGGQYERKKSEKFCNTFQGKLAETVLYNYFKDQNLESRKLDFEIYGEGVWDDSDLEIKGRKINVKSVAAQSNLLLLETKDWNYEGQYIPNLSLNNNSTIQYDYFILVRIQPDIKKLFTAKKCLYNDEMTKNEIEELIFNSVWEFDIAGYCSNKDFINAIKDNNILPQNAMLNQYTKMDASNYYIQSGDLHPIDNLVKILSSEI